MSPAAWRSAASALLVLALVMSGCGGDDDVVVEEAPTPKERGVAPPAGRTTNVDPLRSARTKPARLTITVDDTGSGGFRYRAPRTVRGGLVEIGLRNIGDTPRKAQLWRIEGNHTVKEALRIRHPQPDWLRTAGGVSLTQPGKTSRTLQALPAGRYYVAGILDTPGIVASFTVTGPRALPAPPRAPARIEALDFSFRVSGPEGRPQQRRLRQHRRPAASYVLSPMRAGADLNDVRAFFGQRSSTGTPPVDTEQTRETVVLDLPAGRYALICFVRGRGGGPRHLELGMINEVTVR